MNKTISFVGSVGIPARYGGFETLVEQLVNELSDQFKIIVFCTKSQYSREERTKYWQNVQRYFIPFKANGFQSIIYDFISLVIAYRKSNTILILGGSVGVFLPIFSILYPGKKIIFHPDGKEWSRKKWNSLSKLYLYTSIKLGCRSSTHIIVDNKALLPDYKEFVNKIVYCTYGGDQFNIIPNKTSDQNFWLTIARAEPENKLELIAESFIGNDSQKWILISNFEQTKFGRKLYNKYKDHKNITIQSPEYTKSYIEKYLSSCKGYIHGNSAGGTNPSLTAAMWLNKPLICHNNIFNRETTHNCALFFNTQDQLSEILKAETYNKTKLSIEALSIAKEHYTWKKVASAYRILFESVKSM
jgi:glycosyltransferase involved in cell wall biosynthesis